MLWNIWTNRNRFTIVADRWPLYKIYNEIRNLGLDIASAFSSDSRANSSPRMVSWIPPGENQMALNTDGSSLGNPGKSGYGGIIRDNHGRWRLGFYGGLSFSDSLHAELMGIIMGLKNAWNLHITNLICYSDSALVIHLITEGDLKYHKYAALIMDIRHWLSKDWQVMIQHTLREENVCTDFLAKGALHHQDFVILTEPLHNMSHMLLADAT